MPFRDYFSKYANDYVRYRPGYPAELFEYLASLASAHDLAWDCGTGSGQAAVGLAPHFTRVIATDASQEQVQFAIPNEKVEYRVEPAEGTTMQEHTVDLITVGVAVHWFEFEPFYAEVRRVAKPGAVIAVWTYHYPSITPGVDRIIDRYNRETLDGYWPERIHYLTEHYTTLPFPFEPIFPPGFRMHTQWSLTDLVGFIRSWSATQRYLAENGPHSLEMTWMDLEQAWGDAQTTRSIRWPLYLKVGKVN